MPPLSLSRPHDDGVAGDRHGAAEFIARRTIMNRVRNGHDWVPSLALNAVEAKPCRRPGPGRDHDGVAIDGHGDAELVALPTRSVPVSWYVWWTSVVDVRESTRGPFVDDHDTTNR